MFMLHRCLVSVLCSCCSWQTKHIQEVTLNQWSPSSGKISYQSVAQLLQVQFKALQYGMTLCPLSPSPPPSFPYLVTLGGNEVISNSVQFTTICVQGNSKLRLEETPLGFEVHSFISFDSYIECACRCLFSTHVNLLQSYRSTIKRGDNELIAHMQHVHYVTFSTALCILATYPLRICQPGG